MKKIFFQDFFIYSSVFVYMTWLVLSGFFLHFDNATRLASVAIFTSFFICCYCYKSSLSKVSAPLTVWMLWGIYQAANLVARGGDYVHAYKTIPFFIFIFCGKLAFFAVVATMLLRNSSKTVVAVSAALSCNCLLFLIFGEITTYTGNVERLLSNVINANEIAFSAVTLVVLCCYMLLKSPKTFLFSWLGILLAVVVITYAASRTAFACLVPIAIWGGWNILRSKFKLITSIIIAAIIAVTILLPVWNYIENRTAVGYRFQYREQEMERLQLRSGIISRVLGERSIYVYDGVDLWLRNPIFGVGYLNYINYSRYGTVCHIEYIAQLAEGGAVGFLIYGVFLSMLIYPLLKKKALALPEKTLAWSALFVLAMVQLGSFVSMKNDFYVLCACILVGPMIKTGTASSCIGPLSKSELAKDRR